MSGEQSDNQLPQSDDLTDVDLYCLHCGYNLRGLSGDPRRCPECGQFSPLGEAAVPGPFLRRSQRRLRAPPSLCVVDGFFCILGLCGVVPGLLSPQGIAETPGGFFCCCVVLLLWAPYWVRHIREFGGSCRYAPGWIRLLLIYHVVGYLGVAFPVVVFSFFFNPPIFLGSLPTSTGWKKAAVYLSAALLVAVTICSCAAVLHRLNARRTRMQEGVALEWARRLYRESLMRRR